MKVRRRIDGGRRRREAVACLADSEPAFKRVVVNVPFGPCPERPVSGSLWRCQR